MDSQEAIWLIETYVVDWFTLGHVLLWALYGWICYRCRSPLLLALFGGLTLGIGWELLEMFVVEPLLRFSEPDLNRWLMDPIADVGGVALGWLAARLWKGPLR